uniref:Ubiquinone biosynthesis O-methyltransferase, mitochondrial n=1 Tax=Erpetoichthys calabaricus TaxID=27687 RepID=A0A8C4RQY9_ERPCA
MEAVRVFRTRGMLAQLCHNARCFRLLSTLTAGNKRQKLQDSMTRPRVGFFYKTVMICKAHLNTASSTLDSSEIKKFQALANKWWDQHGEFAALHSMNDLRVPFVRDNLLNLNGGRKSGFPLSGYKILDVGCGGGVLSEPLARLGACITGIDPVEDSIKTAQLHQSFDPFLDKHIHYKACALEDITEEAMETFDGVVASEVVEHVSNVESFIKCCHKILKPEASLFITTINKTKLSYVFGILVAENMLKLLPKGTHEWEKFISPVELERIMESNGFSVKSIKGMLYNPISGLWSWIDSTAINYAIHAVKEKVPPEPDYCRSEDKDQPEDRT